MKNIICAIIRGGFSMTKKYTSDDLVCYFYPLRHIIEQNDSLGICMKANPFWGSDNNEKRKEFCQDLQGLKKSTVHGTRYAMLNRFENGDKYGIATQI